MWNVAVMEVVWYIFRIPVHREESISKNNKRITMAQYENNLRMLLVLEGVRISCT